MTDGKIDPIEFGRVLGRLDAQDIELKALKTSVEQINTNISDLLAMANQSRGGFLMLFSLGSVLMTIAGWFAGHWFK